MAGQTTDLVILTAPVLVVAIMASLLLARQVTALAMGDEVARGLGVASHRLRWMVLLCVVVLTAGSVAIAGPLGFVGLVIPHAVRLFCGADYGRIIPYSVVAGGGYLLVVDTIARMALRPTEISTGILTALIGAPVFIFLIVRRAG